MEPASVEITDTGKWRLRHGNKLDVVADSLFPRPMRFREVWKKVSSVLGIYSRAERWERGGVQSRAGICCFWLAVGLLAFLFIFAAFRLCFSMSSTAPRRWVGLYVSTTLPPPGTLTASWMLFMFGFQTRRDHRRTSLSLTSVFK